jgi:dipeptidyl-peptidase-4
VIWSVVFGLLSAAARSEDLTIEALHAEASLSGPSVRKPAFSPDGRLVTVLRGRAEDARMLDLWAYDVVTGDASVLVRAEALQAGAVALSEEEKNRRERQRIYDAGIIAYQWDERGERLLLPAGGDVYLYDLEDGSTQRLTQTPDAFETDARLSPDGRYVSFVRDDELFVHDIATGEARQVTRGAGGTIRNAVAEFVAQEELSRSTGYWWSDDGAFIAFTQIDEAPVAVVERLDFTEAGARTIRQRYPFAGTDNVRIRLGITTPRGGVPVWADLGDDTDMYLVDVVWHAGRPHVLRLARDHQTLDLLAVDIETGAAERVLRETSDTWLNVVAGMRGERNGLYPLEDGGFLWLSERSGWRHVYRYDATGRLRNAVTAGEWPVTEIACVDEAAGVLWFTGWRRDATEQHLFRVSLAGGDSVRVTRRAGWHTAQFDNGCDAWIHTFSAVDQPPQTSVHGAGDGERRFWLLENALDGEHPYAPYLDSHLPWIFGHLEAADGQRLDYRYLRPADAIAAQPAPAVQLVYGGPGAQRVRNRWGALDAQLLADRGYVVFMLDNRGATNRGKAFEDVIFHRMGQPEVIDQAAGTRWLAAQPWVDGDRIGVRGWSYGGYMTLMMLAQRPDLYAAGVAGAPVTDWRSYDTAYTERYMGDPREVSDAYDAASVLTYIDGIRDDALLLMHGMADDNVVFQNSLDVMAALQRLGTRFELMTYPGEKHGFRQRQNRVHRDRTALRFLDRRLSPSPP